MNAELWETEGKSSLELIFNELWKVTEGSCSLLRRGITDKSYFLFHLQFCGSGE